MVTYQSPWNVPPSFELVGAYAPAPPWLERIVELHVLAEHGDGTAAAVAAEWTARDPDARHVWDQVERTREQLGNPTSSP